MRFRLIEDMKKTIKAYHGTDSVFNRFKNTKGGIGYWFSTDKDYANEHGNYLLEVLLHLSNVLDLEVQEDEFLNLRDEFFGKRVDEKTIFSSKEFGNFLSSKGYDAMSWSHNDGTTYVVFNPDDIEIKRTLGE